MDYLKKALIIFITFFISNTTLFSNEDPQFWQIGLQPLGTYKDILFSFRQEYRLNMPRWKCLDVRLSLYCKKSWDKYLDTEFHYTFIAYRHVDITNFRKRHRFEFEINPRIYINDNTYLFFRNRLELVKLEDRATWEPIFRQRVQFTRDISNSPIKAVSLHNEIFYNFYTGLIFEYRFCPLELLLDIEKKHAYRVGFLVRFIKHDLGWDQQWVLSSALEW